ncbi:Cof-type HAD-IIB family hydrolase [Acetobacter lambici]|uniref:HAD family hydrolase n=1 Tax=Acetobacter lambici TaxID=1332824 RepID=A0ABT1F226_9PROT|nr:HAD family hydrolase [Acetobacter lambici]MCP1243294.1 HAD family hydrolase [Acetobacter lambici]MCP1259267.1 HAD family hydrolase [Acetobacter lambici]NHO57426.1 Cof-type HAD-IIB family hydrolase [Acetobacter lambici]
MAGFGQNRHGPERPPARHIRLVVSDMDGTLLTPDKQITAQSVAAAQTLRAAGIPLCLVSSRPPGGMEMYFGQLGLNTPYGALNGGTLFNPDRTIRSSLALDPQTVLDALNLLEAQQVDTWLFRGHEWLVRNAQAPLVQAESRTVQTIPTQVTDLRACAHNIGKVAGSTADHAALHEQQTKIGHLLTGRASVALSSKWFLDITPLHANKGHAVRQLAADYGISVNEVACLGDMDNDIPMLSIAGLAIAMGQATPDVQACAHYVSSPNTQEGWARAITDFVLPRCTTGVTLRHAPATPNTPSPQ